MTDGQHPLAGGRTSGRSSERAMSSRPGSCQNLALCVIIIARDGPRNELDNTMQLRMFGASDVGLVRSSNQDSFFFSPEYGIAILSDGMGGHRGGKVASQMVVEGLKEAYISSNEILLEHVDAFLDETLRRINDQVFTESAKNPSLRGMGATVNYLQFAAGTLSLGHAGDSRTYFIQGFQTPTSKLKHGMWQLTIDHNVGTFVERGLLRMPNAKQPLDKRQRSRLMCGIGVSRDLAPDIYYFKLSGGEVFLTCSDGLHDVVPEREILKILASVPIETAPKRLIEMAKKYGAPDNVTVIICTYSDDPEPLMAPSNPPKVQYRPFLVRCQSGELRGPLPAETIIGDWTRGRIPSNGEVCASLDKWVMLDRATEILKHYPEFNTDAFKRQLDFARPTSILDEERSKEAPAPKKRNPLRLLSLSLLLVIVALAAIIVRRLQEDRMPVRPAPEPGLANPLPLPPAMPSVVATPNPTVEATARPEPTVRIKPSPSPTPAAEIRSGGPSPTATPWGEWDNTATPMPTPSF